MLNSALMQEVNPSPDPKPNLEDDRKAKQLTDGEQVPVTLPRHVLLNVARCWRQLRRGHIMGRLAPQSLLYLLQKIAVLNYNTAFLVLGTGYPTTVMAVVECLSNIVY